MLGKEASPVVRRVGPARQPPQKSWILLTLFDYFGRQTQVLLARYSEIFFFRGRGNEIGRVGARSLLLQEVVRLREKNKVVRGRLSRRGGLDHNVGVATLGGTKVRIAKLHDGEGMVRLDGQSQELASGSAGDEPQGYAGAKRRAMRPAAGSELRCRAAPRPAPTNKTSDRQRVSANVQRALHFGWAKNDATRS